MRCAAHCFVLHIFWRDSFAFCFIFCRPNVCTERKEELSEWEGSSDDDKTGESQLRQAQSVHFGVHISLNSCVERTNKHVCKTV